MQDTATLCCQRLHALSADVGDLVTSVLKLSAWLEHKSYVSINMPSIQCTCARLWVQIGSARSHMSLDSAIRLARLLHRQQNQCLSNIRQNEQGVGTPLP